ncbi:MAG: tail fiber domain-containing protein [Sphingobacteriales bacterium]|nr:MAG: tail fiber domain-containing protein [Sphingobacteriales bacterium]
MFKHILICILIAISSNVNAQTQVDSMNVKKVFKLNGKRVFSISNDTALAAKDSNALITDYAAKKLIKPETDPIWLAEKSNYPTTSSIQATYPPFNGTGAYGTWPINISGNAATVSNGVYTNGSYSNPSWLNSLAYSKVTGAPTALSQFSNDVGYITGSYTGFDTRYRSSSWVPSWTDITSRPTALSQFTNDLGNYGGFLTSYTETDPTIYAWAKAATKPSYTYTEVGAQPLENQRLSTSNTPSFFSLSLSNGLLLNNSTYPQVNFQSSNGNISRILYNGGGNDLVWRYDGTNDATILNTYNYNSFALPLSGGTITGPMSVNGDIKVNNLYLDQYNFLKNQLGSLMLAQSYWGFRVSNLSGTIVDFGDSISHSLNTNFKGSVTAPAFYNSSDLRLKKIIQRKGDMVTYRWKDGRDKLLHYGYIAQEVQKKMPNQIMKDNNGYLSVNYTEVHTKKINELENEVAELKQQINELKKLLKALQK